MIRINLLPHREIRRKQQQKEFYVMLGAVAGLGVTIWFAMHTYLNGQLEEQQGRNGYLEGEIATLDKEIEEIQKLKEQTAALLQRKKIVESLQANRAETVYLLDQLVRQLPDGVYLKGIAQKGGRINVNGFAQSNARVSTFMRNLESSPYLENPSLIEIKAVTERNRRISEFSLAVSLTRTLEDTSGKKPAVKPVAKPAAKPVAASAIPTAQVVAPAAKTSAPAQGSKK
ncbi:MAG: PilN domain-containing protein [Betaproteobacteria bacterium]|nr:PilN domain-containing protein [Betaproteobacteria bacterium]